MKRTIQVLVVLVFAGAALVAQSKEIRIALVDIPMVTTPDEMPGFGHGVVCDLMTAACSAAGLDFKPVYVPLKRATALFEGGDINFIYGNSQNLAGRTGQKVSDYATVPFFVLKSCFFYCKPNLAHPDQLKGLEDLKGLRAGLPRGHQLTDAFKKAGIIPVDHDDIGTAFRLLRSGHMDVLFCIDIVGYSSIKKLFPLDASQFDVLGFSAGISTGGLVFKAANKEAEDIALLFKAGMDAIVKNGTYRAIAARYWGKAELPEYLFEPFR